MNFPNEVQVEYSPIFKRQSAYTTALDASDLTQSFRANVKSMTPQLASKVFTDCSTQFMQTKRTLGRWNEISIEFETDQQTAAGWHAFALGSDSTSGSNPLTHQINMIAGRQLPVTTLRVGFNDGVDNGWIVKDVCVADISLSARSGFDSVITCSLRLLASGDVVEGASTSWATCYSGTPSTLFDAAGALIISGTDYIDTTHAVSVSYSNNISPESAFVAGSDEVQRWLRGRVRTYAMNFSIEGIDGADDPLSQLARANKLAGTIVTNTSWTFGTSGNTFACKVPTGYLSFQGTPQGFLGENQGEAAVLNLTIQARKATSGATEPFNTTAVIPTSAQSGAYLTT